jgi:uncharacterized glyoxalase superfamily protein PhnB
MVGSFRKSEIIGVCRPSAGLAYKAFDDGAGHWTVRIDQRLVATVQPTLPDSTELFREELSAKGVEFRGPPEEKFYGIEAMMRDPFGNWFSVTQRK